MLPMLPRLTHTCKPGPSCMRVKAGIIFIGARSSLQIGLRIRVTRRARARVRVGVRVMVIVRVRGRVRGEAAPHRSCQERHLA